MVKSIKSLSLIKILILNIIAAALIFGILSIALVFCDSIVLSKSCEIWDEDHLIENLQCIIAFITSVLWMLSVYKIYKHTEITNIVFFAFPILFALAFIFLAGEELSWGQRIFNIATPEYFVDNNAQMEINVHNIPIISFGSYVLYPAVVFYIITIIWGVLLPLVRNVVILKQVIFIAFPIPRLWTIPYFVTPGLFRLFYYQNFANHAREGMELLFIIAFFLISMHAAIRPMDIILSSSKRYRPKMS
jgi:hypothetical protein